MKRLLQGIMITGLLTSGIVMAEEQDIELSANVGVVSKYMWRGYNLNDDPQVQGGIDLGYEGFYAGVWGGNDQALGTEIDLYFGYNHRFHEYLSLELGYLQYRYDNSDLELDEFHVTADFNYFSVSYHDGENDYDYLEANASFELHEKVSLDLHIGLEDTGADDWNDYGVQINYAINDHYSIYGLFTDKEKHDSEFSFGLLAVF